MNRAFICGCAVLTLLLGASTFAKPLNRNEISGRRLKVPSTEAFSFMQRFGYLESDVDSEALYSEEAVVEAIKNVQRFGSIPQTGIIDEATIKLMKAKRCGVPDIVKSSEGQRKKRYVLGPTRWKKRDITYFISNWSPKLSEEIVARNIKRALDEWGKYGRLNFTRIENPNADIIVKFSEGQHGDNFPFDGPGSILAHAFFPNSGLGGDIHFDEDEEWTEHTKTDEEGTDFFTVAVHELGHSLGLGHSDVEDAIMYPYYQGSSEQFSLGYDDILAMYEYYIKGFTEDDPDRRPPQTQRPSTTSTTERPTYRTPVRERPTYRTTTTERPTYRTTSTEKPTYRTPVRERPTYRTTTTERPTYRTPVRERPTYRTFTTERPTYRTPVRERPTYRPTSTERPTYRTEATTRPTYQTTRKRYTPPWWHHHHNHNPHREEDTVVYEGDFETVEKHQEHEQRRHTSPNIRPTEPSILMPDICKGHFDAVANFRGELFIFKENYIWRLKRWQEIEQGYPVELRQMFPGLPDSIQRIDAAYERPDGMLILFVGQTYWAFDGQRFVEGSPRPLTDLSLPATLDSINAVHVWGKNRKTYFFKEDRFWRYNETTRSMDPGYPRHIEIWRGIPQRVDAATTWKGSTYFFKGTRFWRFDDNWLSATDTSPLPAPQIWLGCPEKEDTIVYFE